MEGSHGDYVGWVLAVIGIAVAIYAIIDVRKQKAKLERLIELYRLSVGESRSFLIGLKPSLTQPVITQVNDHLESIKNRLSEAEAIKREAK